MKFRRARKTHPLAANPAVDFELACPLCDDCVVRYTAMVEHVRSHLQGAAEGLTTARVELEDQLSGGPYIIEEQP